MKSTKYLTELLAFYYATNDVQILEEITNYLNIDWAKFVAKSEIMESNLEIWRPYIEQEINIKALRKVFK
jgi:hypothetical protein|tara:strand:+ start:144 stop:353 length:210 start_codon:yes stop_codon:yes gene_type:complete